MKRFSSPLAAWTALTVAATGCTTGSSPAPGATEVKPLALAKEPNGEPGQPGAAMAMPAMSVDPCPVKIDRFSYVSPRDPQLGRADAAVTWVIFTDLECPFCDRMMTTVSSLRRQYTEQQLRIVFKHNPLPFHKHAGAFAQIGQGVFERGGIKAFLQYMDSIFALRGSADEQTALAVARRSGVRHIQRFRAAFGRGDFLAKVDEDRKLATLMGVRGTPHSYINGVEVSGAQAADKFKAHIDGELQKQAGAQDKQSKQGCTRLQTRLKNVVAQAAKPKRHRRRADNRTWKVPVGKSPYRGDRNALVTLVYFGDYECPFCRRVEPTLQKLRKKYGKDLRVVRKETPLPFHKHADEAAQVAFEALSQGGRKKYWAFYDAITSKPTPFTDSTIEEAAKEAKLNWKGAQRAINKRRWSKRIEADQALSMYVKARGTPHFFINGKRLVGAQSQSVFEEVIDQKLKEAEALVAKGTPRSRVYKTIIKDGHQVDLLNLRKAPSLKGLKLPSRGSRWARVTIQEFADFQCPFCSRVQPTVDKIFQTFPKKVKLVYRHDPLPFHKRATPASLASISAFFRLGNKGFWKMHDKLYANQRGDGLKGPSLLGFAKELGIPEDDFNQDMASSRAQDMVAADKMAAKAGKVTATPAFFINDCYISGAQPFPKFRVVINEALKGKCKYKAPKPGKAKPKKGKAKKGGTTI